MKSRSTKKLGAVAVSLVFFAASIFQISQIQTANAAVSTQSGTVNWWGWTPDDVVAKKYIATFNKQYPKIKVNFKKLTIDGYNAALRPALASSVGPDVYNVAPGAANGSVQIYGKNAVDLTPAVTKLLGANWKTKLAPIGVSTLMLGKKLAGLSIGAVYSGTVWINKDLFDKYNLVAPKTYADWKNVCETFKKNDVGCFVQGAAMTAFNEDTLQGITDNVKPGVWQKALEGKTPWTDPAIVKAFKIWKQMFDDGIVQEGALGMQQYPEANNAFMAQKYAMVMMGTWYMQYSTVDGNTGAISGAGVASPKTFTQVPIPLPDVSGSGNVGAMYGDADFGLAVNAKSKNIAAATTFVTWLTATVPGQQLVADILNNIPALKGVYPNWKNIKLVNPAVQKPALEATIAAAGKSNEPRLATVSPDLQTLIGTATTTVAAGKATPEEATKTLQDGFSKLTP